MAKVKKLEVNGKSIEALKEDLKSKREELFKARLDLSKGNLKNTSSMTNTRKDVARILTAMNMKKEVKNG